MTIGSNTLGSTCAAMNCGQPIGRGQMSFASSRDTPQALRSLSAVLVDLNEPQLASSFRRLAIRFESAQTAEDRRGVRGEALAYFRGMNSLNDLVITHDGKPDVPANRRLDAIRRQVYDLLLQEV